MSDRRDRSAPVVLVTLLVAIAVCAAGCRGVDESEIPAASPDRLRVFLLPAEHLVRLKARIADQGLDSPALRTLREEGDAALTSGPFSVMYKTRVPPSGDKHDYMSQAIYWWPDPTKEDGLPYINHDGEVNPEPFGEGFDWVPLETMCQVVESAALAYYLFDEQKYADHAARLMRVWFLDPETRMNPNFVYAAAIPGRREGNSGGIIGSRYLARVVDAVGLIATSESWTPQDQAGMQDWFDAYLDWLLTSKNGKTEGASKNNHGTYYRVQVVSYALFTGRYGMARRMLEVAKSKQIRRGIDPQGIQLFEVGRAKSYFYFYFNLYGLFWVGQLGEAVGVDMWNYETRDGRGIRKAIDFMTPYTDPGRLRDWPFEQAELKGAAKTELQVYQGFDVTRGNMLWLIRRAAAVYDDDDYRQSVIDFGYDGMDADIRGLLYPAPSEPVK